MSTTYERTALLALPGTKQGSSEKAGLLSWSRPYLIERVRDTGVDVVVSRGAKAFEGTQGTVTDVVRPEYTSDMCDVVVRNMGTVGLDDLSLIRNIVRAVEADTATPFLNPNTVRGLAKDKYVIAQKALEPSGVYSRGAVYIGKDESDQDVDAKIASIPGPLVVAKPNGGLRSRGVLVGTKTEVISNLRGREVPYIVEEKLDFSAPFPELRGINSDEQSRLEFANAQGVNKELRMYYFGNGVWDSVGRIARSGETDFRDDKWLYVDLESIPGGVIEGGNRVVRAIQRLTGTGEFNIAIDWVYASSHSDPEAQWKVMEVNAAEPQLVQLHEQYDVGRRHHQELATQISRIALS